MVFLRSHLCEQHLQSVLCSPVNLVLQLHLLVQTDPTRLVPWCRCRFCQHQRPEHAGKEGQRGGGDRGGLGDGDGGDGRAAIPGWEIRPAAPARVLQVLKPPAGCF